MEALNKWWPSEVRYFYPLLQYFVHTFCAVLYIWIQTYVDLVYCFLFCLFFLNSFCRSRQCGPMSHSACPDPKRRGQEDGRIQGKAKATTEKGWICVCVKKMLLLWHKTPSLFVHQAPWLIPAFTQPCSFNQPIRFFIRKPHGDSI